MKKTVGVLLFTLFINTLLSAESLTLNQAIDILRANNLEIKAAKLDLNIAKRDEQTVNGMFFGKLDLTQDIANSDDAGNVFGFKLTSREATMVDFGVLEMQSTDNPEGTPIDEPGDTLNYPDAHNFFQTKLKYELPLFTGFQLTNYSNIMKATSRLKSLDKDKVLNEKIYELRKSYYDMALLRNSTKNLNNILKNIYKLENMTRNMIQEGYAKKVDLLEVKAKKGNVTRLLLEMNSNQRLLYHYISFLLNRRVNNITTPNTSVAMPNLSTKSILNNNLDIKKAKIGLEIRKDMIGVSKASYYPMVGMMAEVATADDTFLGDAGDHMAYTVGARLSWNVFNGGIDKANVEKAKIEHLKTKTQVELARKGIGLQVAKIKTEIKTSDEKINSLQKELALANEIYNNYEGRYREKLSSMSDVIIKQSEQIQKILELQMAINERNERIFALEKLSNGEK
jgi:outer membrane protein TolC